MKLELNFLAFAHIVFPFFWRIFLEGSEIQQEKGIVDTEISYEIEEISSKSGKKNKRGRPTVAPNFLEGDRNAWIRLLEEAWAEIGWPLINMRDRRKNTFEDVQRALILLKDKPNGGLAQRYYRDSWERANLDQIRRNWKSISGLDAQILEMKAKRDNQARACLEAEQALKQTDDVFKTEDPKINERIQLEIARRRASLATTAEQVQRLESEREALYNKVVDQESYVCRSELLDFLESHGRYAVKPRPLANALAGLPRMRWRQSYVRCAPMRYDLEAHLYYRTCETLRKLWKHRQTEFDKAPVHFFQTAIVSLPKKSGYVRQFLCENWRDLRLAIEESWETKHPPTYVPFAIAVTFIKLLLRPKNAVERVLAEQEKLGYD